MNKPVLAIALFFLSSVCQAQTSIQDAKQLSGKFLVGGPGGYTQDLSLADIQANEGKLTAKLTLFARVSRCTVRNAPVSVLLTESGFTIDGEGFCWKYKFVGAPGKEHKFEGTLTTDNGNASTFYLD